MDLYRDFKPAKIICWGYFGIGLNLSLDVFRKHQKVLALNFDSKGVNTNLGLEELRTVCARKS
jgi:hypothetical protein